jgi:ANTAR domain/Phosphoserine phosphatase RsbU, N-terminal domain
VIGDAYERFRRDYAPVFLQYLSERGERGRRAAYELGRRAIVEQLSVLDLARIHHGILLDVLKSHQSSQELEQIAQAASEFLVEALAVFEMTQRGFTELLSTLGSDQHHDQDIQAELEQKQALERATGVLMERHGLPADTAAERIRQTAARQGIAVEEAATRLLRQPSADGRADPDDSAYRLRPQDVMPDGS